MHIKVQSETPKFQCNACGKCCSHIRGFIPQEDREFLKEYVFGKLPVIQLVPVEQMTFPLWDWEAKRFKEWQKEANIDANIKPLRAILDLNSNKAIIITYFMDSNSEACPFLKKNKCTIYHTKRAYVCRLFPFNRGPFLKDPNMQFTKDQMFGSCGAMEKLIPQVPDQEKEMIKFLNQAFPAGEFENIVQNDILVEWSNKIVIDLMKKKLIKPAMNYPYKFLSKRIQNAEKVDFTDFLVESSYFSRGEMQNLINKFDNNQDAREKIAQILS